MSGFMSRFDADDLIELLKEKPVKRYLKGLIQEIVEDSRPSGGQVSTGYTSMDYYTLKRKLDNYESEVLKLRSEAEEFAQQKQNWENWYQQAKERLEELEQDNAELKDTVDQQKSEIEGLIAKQEEGALDELMQEGVKLFASLEQLGANSREHLRAICPRDTMASFLGGLAQEESLAIVWEEAYNSLLKGNQEDANLLWRIFMFALNFVNETKSEARFEYIPDQTGEEYNPELHVIDRNGLVQGIVQQTLIPGFYNVFSGEVIQRSFVVLG